MWLLQRVAQNPELTVLKQVLKMAQRYQALSFTLVTNR